MNLTQIQALFPTANILPLPDPDMIYGWRTVNVDMTSRYGYQWPYPGNWAHPTPPAEITRDTVPGAACGPGLHVAKTIRGATSLGYRRTVQIVGYFENDILGQDDNKLRVLMAWVAGLGDLHSLAVARANLTDANLTDANLTNANLADANLAGANLAGANLRYANLAGANLVDANLAGADLRYANLARANLARANLARANLTNAYLRYANLARANLAGANLAGADLVDADLAGADLVDADLTRARGDRWTRLPVGWVVVDGLVGRA